MICPKCGENNTEDNSFCISCGAKIGTDISEKERQRYRSHLGLETMRVVISVFGLLILNWLVMSMGFIRDLRFPGSRIMPTQIIESIIYLVILIILLRFSKYLANRWPFAFPKYYQAVLFFQTILILVALSLFYGSTTWIIQELVTDAQGMLVYQLLFVTIAVILIVRACIYFYQVLPRWLHQMTQSMQLPADPTITEDKD
jgi:hypothetical protein